MSLNFQRLPVCGALLALSVPMFAQLVREANTTLILPAELPSATGWTTENALGTLTFSDPLDVAAIPGVPSRLFVVERGVGLQMVNLDTMTKSTFMNLASYLTAQGTPLMTDSESGILSAAFHPNYNDNGYFYLFYSIQLTHPTNGTTQRYQRVGRFQATGTAGNYNAATSASPVTEFPLISQRDQAGNHNGGDLAFGPDGYLYISVGDEGQQRDGGDNARRIAKDFFGGILRIDVDQRPGSLPPNTHIESSSGALITNAVHAGAYRIPPDNPWANLPVDGSGNSTYNGFTFQNNRVRTEFFAIGFRNPWRMSFDPATGRLFVADVGQDTAGGTRNAYEEVNIVTNGFNGGWSWREGPAGPDAHIPAVAPFTPPADFAPDEPIYYYDHTNDGAGSGVDHIIHGTSITGGVVYRGDRLPELYGAYLFCDYNTGFMVALRENENGTWTGTRLATDNRISGFGYDPRNGDAIFCDRISVSSSPAAGTVKRLARSGTSGTPPPSTLSATGAFSNLATLAPHAGIVPYEPNVAFWSDYAIKSRWFCIKNITDKMAFDPTGNWEFPAAMVWVKHFDFDVERGNPATRRKFETRFLVKTANDVYGISYKWRADQSDADLVTEAGLTELIPGSNPPQVWRFPSRSECRQCHTQSGGFALSFNSWQLNREVVHGAHLENQISALSNAGYFSEPVSGVNLLPAFARADDTTQSLEWRARSYLTVNCVQCHQPGSTPAIWDARPTTPTMAAHLVNGLLTNPGNDPANRFAVPGDLARSMVLKRLQGDGVPRMPPLATSERDLAAEQLLSDWITQELPSRLSFGEWQFMHFGSTAAPEAQPQADPDHDGASNAFEFLRRTSPLAPNAPLLITGQISGGNVFLSFEHPANCAAVFDTSTDLLEWNPLDAPGNAPFYPRENTIRTIVAPLDTPKRFFKLRLTEP